MTEYKKLVVLVDELRCNVAMLCANNDTAEGESSAMPCAFSSLDVSELFRIATCIRTAVASGATRIQKLVLKARETDPNRQIYNEAMCEKIEVLFSDFIHIATTLLQTLERQHQTPEDEEELRSLILGGGDFPFDDSAVLSEVEHRHDQYILEKSKAEAWASRVAGDLSQNTSFEQQGRQAIESEEKVARVALAQESRAGKAAVLEVLRQAAEAKWNSELSRRQAERRLLEVRARGLTAHTIGDDVSSLIQNETARAALVAHLRDLGTALMTTPEDINIRKLRCNHQRLIEDYGHPCLFGCATGICRQVLDVAELVWTSFGYVPLYTAQPSADALTLLKTGGLSDARLPCGELISNHEYRQLGFEPYSERLFELKEPDPSSDPDGWMSWFDHIRQVTDALAKLAR